MVTSCIYHEDYNEDKLKSIIASGLLIIPTVSYANMDQMVIDLILFNSLKSNSLKKVATIHSKYVTPIIGTSPFSVKDDSFLSPTTSIELFHIVGSSIFVLQQRSQPKDGMASNFVDDMMYFINSINPQSVILFTGADSTYYDMTMDKETIAYYTSTKSVLNTVGESIQSMDVLTNDVYGGGLFKMYQTALITLSIPYTIFIAFVTESNDNIHDAISFFSKVNSIMNFISVETIDIPPAWKLSDSWFDEDDAE